MSGRIEVGGLRDLQRALRTMDTNLPKQIRLALNKASNLIIDTASPRIPRRTGRAAASLLARSSQRQARVALGGRRAPYAPWLDFGGGGKRVGRPPYRRFIVDGRYVWKAYEEKRPKVIEIMEQAFTDLAREAGLDVS